MNIYLENVNLSKTKLVNAKDIIIEIIKLNKLKSFIKQKTILIKILNKTITLKIFLNKL